MNTTLIAASLAVVAIPLAIGFVLNRLFADENDFRQAPSNRGFYGGVRSSRG